MYRSGIPPRPRLSLLPFRDPPSRGTAEGSHARARARPAVTAENWERRAEEQPPLLPPRAQPLRSLPPLGSQPRGCGRAAGPGALHSLLLAAVPASSHRSSSGRGAVGACAEPPPPRPRPASPRATATRYRRRRRRCACCSSPSPLQCEGLEDGRLAELRG